MVHSLKDRVRILSTASLTSHASVFESLLMKHLQEVESNAKASVRHEYTPANEFERNALATLRYQTAAAKADKPLITTRSKRISK